MRARLCSDQLGVTCAALTERIIAAGGAGRKGRRRTHMCRDSQPPSTGQRIPGPVQRARGKQSRSVTAHIISEHRSHE